MNNWLIVDLIPDHWTLTSDIIEIINTLYIILCYEVTESLGLQTKFPEMKFLFHHLICNSGKLIKTICACFLISIMGG